MGSIPTAPTVKAFLLVLFALACVVSTDNEQPRVGNASVLLRNNSSRVVDIRFGVEPVVYSALPSSKTCWGVLTAPVTLTATASDGTFEYLAEFQIGNWQWLITDSTNVVSALAIPAC